ncbi:Cysteine-rich membrane protein 1 [Spironucleus salmonicida]|uniref:Cysteine-rich membrane protein 1 n=1 Tax=Spironucleus salmonicida TaxID=348837 RepID=V6LI36_9EUKA|nr:Cysteine-rich membrane protein 1 [Spironucleus salmonicida]|eukprot:EST44230.1 Cysteine-rich membrane protein 1 [Spironucleus salmonicida]
MLGTCSGSTNNCTGNSFCPDSTTTSTDCLPCKYECLTCSGTSADNTICKTCRAGMYLTTRKTCNYCDPTCLTCATSQYTCTSCREGDRPRGDICVTPCTSKSDCASNQICGNTFCLTCFSACTSCVGSLVNCTNCSKGYALVGTSCRHCTARNCDNCDGQLNTCKKCNSGFRLQGTACQPCAVTNCSNCAASKDTCELCKNNYSLSNNTCTACAENLNQQCQCGMAENCTTCGASNSGVCGSCLPGFFKGTDAGSDTCTACSANCINCTSNSVCTSCANGFFLKGGKCVVCDDANCKTCPGKKDTCTVCKDGFSILENKCIKQCSSRVECKSNQICDTICKDCTGNCATCKGSVATCLTCESSFILDGGKCSSCPNNCVNCDGDKNYCKICKDGFFNQDGTCTECDGKNSEKCTCGEAVNCATCEASNKSKCGTCIIGYKKADDGTCQICDDGYLMMGIVCEKCNDTCATCSKGVDVCDTCQVGHQITIHQTCQTDCGTVLAEGNACIGDSAATCGDKVQTTECKCTNAKNCLICNHNNTKCGSCLPGYKFESDECQKCDDGAEQTGAFCFSTRKEYVSLSGGTVTKIVIAVLVVAGGAGGVLTYYFIKKAKK